MSEPLNVLFLCTGNSARSIMAEAIMNRIGAPKLRAYSAGSMPTGRVNPHALSLLRKLGYPTEGLRSKSWEEFCAPGAPRFDFVFTVCSNAATEICPVWPGQPISAHWGVPDPAAASGTETQVALAFADAFRMLGDRIGAFAGLPLADLDRPSLQRRLQAIGRLDDPSAPAEACASSSDASLKPPHAAAGEPAAGAASRRPQEDRHPEIGDP